MKRIIAAFFLLLVIGLPVSAHSSTGPMEAIQGPLDEVINILKDPQYQAPEQKEVQREKIWNIIREIFDFNKIAHLALAKYRKKFDEKQLKEFTDLFAKLLEDTYLNKIQAEYKNEKINYLSQKIGAKSKSNMALVKTKVTRENVEIPVDYRMWLNKGVWRVYDIKVEGVSLVKNYRNQFQNILLNKSPDHLIEQVRTKVEKQKKEKIDN
ncbi:MlaC/ttg2D family ABC transporter substrate-binding protein [Desulfonema magnum]|uniref:Intermembrane phospholipid transport system binding protein n=1 Tax=Desulfonema magnum TaxID=45655 RepID=A0A975BP95_9BACT|nr:ABC transporter substrate-binding protein [Desulfonema magnum]QTA88922.1 Intermembrane phospholipid transport system binding protein [Desulfonema magnum]